MSSQIPESTSVATDSNLNVSLAGSQGALDPRNADTLTAALEEAFAALDEIQEGGGDSPLPRGDLSPAMELISGMSRAASRRDAAVCLTEMIAAKCKDCTIRCGIGDQRLSRVYDARLGWLAADSPVYQQIANEWTTPKRRAGDTPEDQTSFRRPTIHRIEINLPHPHGSGRCTIWIDAKTDLTDRLVWFSPICETVGAVLWSRPIASWPAVAGRIMAKFWSMILAASVLLGVLAIWPVHYRVACNAVVETSEQRLVSTPFEATLQATNVKPGDTVTKGEVLLVLDGRPLRLEREAVLAEAQQAAKEQDVALASGRVAEAQQSGLKKQQLQRRYDLLTDRLNRLEVISPIDGVVVSGDLEKYVGSVLERGKTLMEIAPMDRMVIEVEIPEHEIGYIDQGADARIKIDAVGGKSIDATIENIYPAAELRDDQNVFVGRIPLPNQNLQLKPGMRGDAVAYGPLRPWIWSWIRSPVEKVLWWIGY